MVELAIMTGIPASTWSTEPDETIVTALEVLRELAERDPDG